MAATLAERIHWRDIVRDKFNAVIAYLQNDHYPELVEQRAKILEEIEKDFGLGKWFTELEQLEKAKEVAEEVYEKYCEKMVRAITGDMTASRHYHPRETCQNHVLQIAQQRAENYAKSEGVNAKIEFLKAKRDSLSELIYGAANQPVRDKLYEEANKYTADCDKFEVTWEASYDDFEIEEVADNNSPVEVEASSSA